MSIIYTNTISAENYNALREAVGWKPSDRARIVLARSDFIIAAQMDGRTAGLARLMHDGETVLIMDVIVLPEHQGQGLGRALMDKVNEYLEELSRGAEIKVHLMSLAGKEGFYETCGFRVRPYGRFGSGMSRIVRKETL